MIEVSAVSQYFGTHAALRDVSFRVEEGEVLGLLGPNGAGKTTTLSIVTGFLAPSAGRVTIAGHDLLEQPRAARRALGYLPERAPLYLDMTLDDYLAFAAEIKGLAPAQARSERRAVCAQLGLSEVRGRLLRNLSKGYRQRTGIAQALLGQPPVIVLDEPLIGLDPRQIAEAREILRGLRKRHTLLISSHILSEIEAICDRVAILHRGRLVSADGAAASGAATLVELRTEAPAKALQTCLRRLEGVEAVEIIPEEQTLRVRLRSADGLALRRRLGFELLRRGWPVLELRSFDLSLEERFMQLTEGEED